MPFPANWLEELVVEWLDFEGFTTSTGVAISVGRGGRWSPDVVGAKMTEARLSIRHYEATMWLIQGPEDVKKKFKEKFSKEIENAVRDYFKPVFGDAVVRRAVYEKCVITCQASKNVRYALAEAVPGIQIHMFKDFITTVVNTIRDKKPKPTTMLPSDKWLLHMIDQFSRDRLLNLPGTNAQSG